MRISPFHMEIAKRLALGQPNREIMKEIQISGSRLSVLKANPVFQRQVEKYQKIEADKYQKAVGVFGAAAEDIAKELVRVAESAGTPAKTKLDAGLAILDRVAQSEGVQPGSGDGEEIVFEQMLRVTKKSMGLDRSTSDSDSDAVDLGKAEKELEEDLLDLTKTPQQRARLEKAFKAINEEELSEGTPEVPPAAIVDQLQSANV